MGGEDRRAGCPPDGRRQDAVATTPLPRRLPAGGMRSLGRRACLCPHHSAPTFLSCTHPPPPRALQQIRIRIRIRRTDGLEAWRLVERGKGAGCRVFVYVYGIGAVRISGAGRPTGGGSPSPANSRPPAPKRVQSGPFRPKSDEVGLTDRAEGRGLEGADAGPAADGRGDASCHGRRRHGQLPADRPRRGLLCSPDAAEPPGSRLSPGCSRSSAGSPRVRAGNRVRAGAAGNRRLWRCSCRNAIPGNLAAGRKMRTNPRRAARIPAVAPDCMPGLDPARNPAAGVRGRPLIDPRRKLPAQPDHQP